MLRSAALLNLFIILQLVCFGQAERYYSTTTSTPSILTSVSQIASYTGVAPVLNITDTTRGGMFAKYTGSLPVDDGMIFLDGNNNKWIRILPNTTTINGLWYGMKSDGATDNRPLFLSAITFIKKNPQYRTLYLPYDSTISNPYNKYYFSDSVLIDFSVKIVGDGTYRNPTTKVQFAANKSGFVFKYAYGENGIYPELEKIRIDGLSATPKNLSKHAVIVNCVVHIKDVVVDAYDGNGIHISACATPPSGDNNNYGNASFSKISGCAAHFCTNGIFIEGCDASVIDIEDTDLSQNRRWGVFDNGFLGNKYDHVHTAFNGVPAISGANSVVNYGGNYYRARPGYDGYFGDASDSNYNKQPDISPTYWEQVTAMSSVNWDNATRYYSGGPICIKNANSWSQLVACYSEASQPPYYLNSRSVVYGGTNGAGVSNGVFWNVFNGEQQLINSNLWVQKNITTVGTISAANFIGSGAGLTGITASASFGALTGQPTDNTNLATALNGKQDVLGNNSVTNEMLAGSIATSKISNYTGYSIKVQALTSSPADGATVYFGMLPKAPVTAAGTSKIYIRKACTLKIAEIYCYSGTAGTNENWSLYVRVNNTTDYLIATVGANTNERVFSNTGLNVSLNAGDYVEIKGIQPTWTTNPLTCIYGGYLYFE